MALAALNTSTLSEALSKETINFTVASTANISVGNYLGIAGTAGFEMVEVQEIPVSGRVKVMRGVAGTKALSHKSGTRFFIGAPDAFLTVFDSSPSQFISLSGSPGTGIIQYAIPGTRATDGNGNQYVMVDLTFSGFIGAGVLISRDGLYTAAALTSSSAGSVGILVEEGTSDQYVWAQIYGACDIVQLVGGSSLVTSTGIFQPASSVSTPAVGILGRTTSQATTDLNATILGAYPTSAASTASTSATSATGLRCSAWLNYPFVLRQPSS